MLHQIAHPFNALRALESRIVRGWHAHLDQRTMRRHLESALRTFAARNPRWNASLFDAAFLARPDARAALEQRDAVALARAWSAQFTTASTARTEHDLERLLPTARTFLAHLAQIERGSGAAA